MHTWIDFCMFYQAKLPLMYEYPSPSHCSNALIRKRTKELLFSHINSSMCKLERSIIHSLSTLPAPILALPTELLPFSETTLVTATTEVVPFKKTWNIHYIFCLKLESMAHYYYYWNVSHCYWLSAVKPLKYNTRDVSYRRISRNNKPCFISKILSFESTKLLTLSVSCKASDCSLLGSLLCITTVCVGSSNDACK